MQNTHGGRRPGAGRKNRSGQKAHRPREKIRRVAPLHVILRLKPNLPSLKRKEIFAILRIAVKNARKKGLAIVHFSILSNHVHFLVETHDHRHLARTIQSLTVSFAKRLNALMKRTGAVFRERFFSRVIRGARQMRIALKYVIANQALHNRRSSGLNDDPLEIDLDPFSSALKFREWKILGEIPRLYELDRWKEDGIQKWYSEILSPARTWLLKEGWRT